MEVAAACAGRSRWPGLQSGGGGGVAAVRWRRRRVEVAAAAHGGRGGGAWRLIWKLGQLVLRRSVKDQQWVDDTSTVIMMKL